MYTVIWQYRVAPENVDAFIAAYGAECTWVRLFRQGAGYIDTQLLRDVSDSTCFVTLDRWTAMDDWEAFKGARREEYMAIDALCDRLTVTEEFIVAFSTLDA